MADKKRLHEGDGDGDVQQPGGIQTYDRDQTFPAGDVAGGGLSAGSMSSGGGDWEQGSTSNIGVGEGDSELTTAIKDDADRDNTF